MKAFHLRDLDLYPCITLQGPSFADGNDRGLAQLKLGFEAADTPAVSCLIQPRHCCPCCCDSLRSGRHATVIFREPRFQVLEPLYLPKLHAIQLNLCFFCATLLTVVLLLSLLMFIHKG